MKQSDIAEAIARKAHAGQFRRDGVTPYITHPERVVATLQANRPGGLTNNFFDSMLATAWLHDVLEDCPEITTETLEADGVDGWVIDHVRGLSNSDGKNYEDYIRGVKCGTTRRMVKVADILDNLTDSPTPKQVAKYKRALMLLAE